jgi:CRISPR-associated protein Cas2
MKSEIEEVQCENAEFSSSLKSCQVGVTVLEYDPSKERYKNMLYLVAYDIRDPRRLRMVAKICLDYGIRVEYSVFECDLSEDFFQQFWGDLWRTIDPEEDAILAYRICGSCVQRIKSMGSIVRPGKTLLYMI